VIDALLLRRPPFKHLDRVVLIEETNPRKLPADFWISPSPANFLDWRNQIHSFDSMAAWRNWYYTLEAAGGQGTPESVRGVRVSPSFFDLVGVNPMLGAASERTKKNPGADGL
jgi:hypothetical protein